MKKIMLLTVVLWMITILIVITVIYKSDSGDDSYRVNINRIHSRLSNNVESSKEFIDSLSQKEKGMISRIEVIDYTRVSRKNLEDFFHIDNIYKNPAVYLSIEGSSFFVKYSIDTANDSLLNQILFLCSFITFIFILIIIIYIYIYRNIILPMKRISKVPEQLASGYIDKLTVEYKNQYFNDFIWGLDMLREQLQEEKSRNNELEKQRKTLVAGLSHDIKTPLSSIKNYAIALKEGIYEETAEQMKALAVILDKTEVIEKLTKKLLKSSHQGVRANVLKVRVNELYMSEIDQRLNQIIQQKIELLHIEYLPPVLKEDLLVTADLEVLSQVFDNIIENAVKYGDMEEIRVNYYQEEYYQCITFENTGKHIAESELKHIFSSYYRGSNVKDQPGYGLGLYICKKLMNAMEGDIYVENTDKGVMFVLVIMLAS